MADDNSSPKRKDLGNFTGPFHSGLGAHFQAGASDYSSEKYDPLNAFLPGRLSRWIPHVVRYWFHKKYPFRDYSSPGRGNGVYPIENRATLSILGDWGTGTDEAHEVADQVRKFQPDLTIHLGDVYYAGDATEVRENFFGEKTSPYTPVKWPMGAKGSFALTGNHEMYARGSGYFNSILPRMGLCAPPTNAAAAKAATSSGPVDTASIDAARLDSARPASASPQSSADSATLPVPASETASEWGSGQWASFFCLQNDHWRIVGVDTGYNSIAFDWGRVPGLSRLKWLRKSLHLKPKCNIPEPAMRWLESTLRIGDQNDHRGIILLSHHGSHSAFAEWYRYPAMQLARLIHRPVIWFWGHEHKLAIYGKFAPPNGIESHARCIGHAGMPVERGVPPDLECNLAGWDNRIYNNDEHLYVGYNGHVNLRLDGPALHADYIDLKGQLLFTEDWRVDPQTGALAGPNLKQVIVDPNVHLIPLAAASSPR